MILPYQIQCRALANMPFIIQKQMTFMDNAAPYYWINKEAWFPKCPHFKSIWQVSHEILLIFDWDCIATTNQFKQTYIFLQCCRHCLQHQYISCHVFSASTALTGNRYHAHLRNWWVQHSGCIFGLDLRKSKGWHSTSGKSIPQFEPKGGRERNNH